jgi:threonine dehydrogenase-like Zn-dependent dehydrogenase
MRAIRNAVIPSRSSTVLILGAGPIGLAVLLCLRARGHNTVIISEPSAGRRKLATEMGAKHVLDPINQDVLARCVELTPDSGGVDVVFDCAGVQAAWDVGMKAVKAKGTIVCVAVWEQKCQVDINWLLFKERRMVGSAAPEHIDFLEVFEALQSGLLKPDGLVTKTVGLDNVEHGGFKSLIEDKATHAKILVEVAGGE